MPSLKVKKTAFLFSVCCPHQGKNPGSGWCQAPVPQGTMLKFLIIQVGRMFSPHNTRKKLNKLEQTVNETQVIHSSNSNWTLVGEVEWNLLPRNCCGSLLPIQIGRQQRLLECWETLSPLNRTAAWVVCAGCRGRSLTPYCLCLSSHHRLRSTFPS